MLKLEKWIYSTCIICSWEHFNGENTCNYIIYNNIICNEYVTKPMKSLFSVDVVAHEAIHCVICELPTNMAAVIESSSLGAPEHGSRAAGTRLAVSHSRATLHEPFTAQRMGEETTWVPLTFAITRAGDQPKFLCCSVCKSRDKL